MSLADQHELGRLRHAELSAFDIKILTRLMQTSGEFGLTVAEDMFERLRGLVGHMTNRDLISIDENRSNRNFWLLRLTDNGRAACAQLEKMNAKPRVEVEMHGDTPVVVKP